ncbi:MAG: hypothetical protein IPK82_02410 [Polyangiaceae bacterium]|nr:hypothetical protein [Polyangiaceae bacterium]
MAAFAIAAVLLPNRARAADFEVQAETAAQAYQVTSPWGDITLDRRRILQTLGLSVYNLQGKYEPGKPTFNVTVKLRLDADFGINQARTGEPPGSETSFDTTGRRYSPGLQEAPLDIMYAYVEGRNLARGWFGFRLGRQYVSDVLGWWSFDGATARITTPFFVQAEVYGGLEQRNGLVLSTGRWERNGIWRGSHAGFGNEAGQATLTDYPSYQYAQPAPAFGAALESAGPSWIHGRVSYRRVYNTGTSITQQFPSPAPPGTDGGYPAVKGMRVSSDRLGYAADLNFAAGAPFRAPLGLKGGFAYDLYANTVSNAFGGAEVYIGQNAVIGVDADYYLPTFDADSIWNWFTHGATSTFTARTAVRVGRRFDFSLQGGARLWTTEGDPNTFGQGECDAVGGGGCTPGESYLDPTQPGLVAYTRAPENRPQATVIDGIGNVAARYRIGSGVIGLRGMAQVGDRGHRAGGDLSADQKFVGDKLALGARASLFDWADPTRPDRNATSFGYVLGVGYQPAKIANFRVEWEHDMNRLVGHRFRVVGLLNLWVMK